MNFEELLMLYLRTNDKEFMNVRNCPVRKALKRKSDLKTSFPW